MRYQVKQPMDSIASTKLRISMNFRYFSSLQVCLLQPEGILSINDVHFCGFYRQQWLQRLVYILNASTNMNLITRKKMHIFINMKNKHIPEASSNLLYPSIIEDGREVPQQSGKGSSIILLLQHGQIGTSIKLILVSSTPFRLILFVFLPNLLKPR